MVIVIRGCTRIRNDFVSSQVFVPSYSGNKMVMLKINGLDDYEKLPLTKWNIKQPNDGEGREKASETGQFLVTLTLCSEK